MVTYQKEEFHIILMLGEQELKKEIDLSKDIKYPPGVELIRNLYFFMVLFIAFLSLFFLLSKDYSRFWNDFLKVIFCFLAFYGIDKRKKWTVPVVLFLSAWGLINFLFYVFSPDRIQEGQIVYYISTLTGVLFLIFYIYSIFIFSKRQTRIFFKEKGKYIF